MYLAEFKEDCEYKIRVEASDDREEGLDIVEITIHHNDEDESETILLYHIETPDDPEATWRKLHED